MYSRAILVAALFWAQMAVGQSIKNQPRNPNKQLFQVEINKNVELLGFAYFLGYEGPDSENNAAYLDKNKARYAYGLAVYQRYKSFAKSKHLAVAISYAETIWLDYLIHLILQLDDFPHAKLKASTDKKAYSRFSPTGDIREAQLNATAFLEALNQLYLEVDFATYLNQSQKHYEHVIGQVKSGLPDASFLTALESFYQGHFDNYRLIPSLMIPSGMAFGLAYTQNNQTHSVHVFGSFGIPSFTEGSTLDLGFNDENHLRELSTHEFGHPFVNPVIDRIPNEVFTRTQPLFESIKTAMSKQAYTTWKSCLSEHFVRAGEIVIAQNLGRQDDASRLKAHYIQVRQFIYLPVILQELEAYNKTKAFGYDQAVARAMKKLQQLVPQPADK
jgi:hypothetical protein